MKLLATITDQDVFENSKNIPTDDFYKRRAARAITLSEDGGVYLLNMSNHRYHKLPGGGVDEGEDIHEALYRELLEEIGCPAEIISEVGEIAELRNEMKWSQRSFCFIARQSGDLVETQLEPGEIGEGAKTAIATSIDEAISILEADSPTTYEGKFIQKRDLMFLREAKNLL